MEALKLTIIVGGTRFIVKFSGTLDHLMIVYDLDPLKLTISLFFLVRLELIRSPPSGVNVAVALRQIYQRLLMPYEKVNYSNFTNDVLDDDEDDG